MCVRDTPDGLTRPTHVGSGPAGSPESASGQGPLRDAEAIGLPDEDVVMQEKTFALRQCDAVGILVARRRPSVGVWCCKLGRTR